MKKVTKKNLQEIKKVVNNFGFGVKVNQPSRIQNQMMVVYKTYLIKPQSMIKNAPGTWRELRRASPTNISISKRDLKPGERLNPNSQNIFSVDRLLASTNHAYTPGRRPRTTAK